MPNSIMLNPVVMRASDICIFCANLVLPAAFRIIPADKCQETSDNTDAAHFAHHTKAAAKRKIAPAL